METGKLRTIINQLVNINSKLEEKDICGPIPSIEEAIENLERAIDELESY
jgi:hypothetical protein